MGSLWFALLAGCAVPTTGGLRSDGYIGEPGSYSGSAAAGITFEGSADATIAPYVVVAGSAGFLPEQTVIAETELRLGGARRFDRPAIQAIGGVGVSETSDAFRNGWHLGAIASVRSGEQTRVYGGFKLNHTNLVAGKSTCFIACYRPSDVDFVELGVGLSARNRKSPVVFGLELAVFAPLDGDGEPGLAFLRLSVGATSRSVDAPIVAPPKVPEPDPAPILRSSVPVRRLEAGFYGPNRINHAILVATAELDRLRWVSLEGGSVGEDARLPATGMTPDEAMAFCDALSREEGLEPAYDGERRLVPGASGWRLPTVDEWQAAAMQLDPQGRPFPQQPGALVPVRGADGSPIAMFGNAAEWAWNADRGWARVGGAWDSAAGAVGRFAIEWDAAPAPNVGFRIVRDAG